MAESADKKYEELSNVVNTLNDKLKELEEKQSSERKKSFHFEQRLTEIGELFNSFVIRTEVYENETGSKNDTERIKNGIQDLLTKVKSLEDDVNVVTEKQTQIVSDLEKCNHQCRSFNVQLSGKIQALETRSQTQRAGFSAEISSGVTLNAGDVITQFGHVTCNVGGHFNPRTGELTVPTPGLYGVGLTVYKLAEKLVTIYIRRRHRTPDPGSSSGHVMPGTEKEVNVATVAINKSDTCGAAFVATELNPGDKLFLQIYRADKGLKFYCGSVFTCFQI
ncbi:uncharacterized protein LOC131951052 [Physella acuta]|uniref:uncharacterized protein LOC131951052 n=1 Tax=Physella acuta TaxID=109671 RepID=UPI0027DCFE66|nr:uncharacterized protein LOC131951052 [Physella acuta]